MNQSVQSCPPKVVMPIIFVPGIMGSRQRNRATHRMVWDPDRYVGRGSVRAQAISFTAGKRLALVGPLGRGFSPTYLEVDPGVAGDGIPQQMIDRGWGGLHRASYQATLAWMQHTAETPAAGQVPNGCFNLKYEVWAHPYNWTDDNKRSGEALAQTVANAIADTNARWGDSEYRTRNARLCDSLVCATCSLTRSPPIVAQSSFHSNWNASPGWNTNGTNVPRPVVCSARCRSARHARAKASTRS
jgi:hypothetical protein